MQGVGAVNQGQMSNVELAAKLDVAVAKKAQDVQKQMGDNTMKLIASASVDPKVGQTLDVLA